MKIITITREKVAENLDKNLAILGLVASSILILWLVLVVGKYVEAGVAAFLACATYLIIRKRLLLLGPSSLQALALNRPAYLILNIAFFVLFIYSLLSVGLRPELYSRPLGYFIATAIMATILAIEIVFLPGRKAYESFVLVKIMLIALSLRWMPQFIFPGLIGVDPWGHQMFTAQILEAGSIPGGYPYSNLPVMHLIIVATSLITDLSYKFATMFSISLLHVVGLVFVFLLGRFVFDSKVGLLAALLLGVAAYWINLGMGIHPTTLALVLVAMLIYMIFKARQERSIILTCLYFLVMGVLILTHTVTALCLAILLFSFWFGFELYKKMYRDRFDVPVTLWLAILFTVAMLSWWTYVSGHITAVAELIKYGFRIERWALAEPMVGASSSEWLLYMLGFLLFYAFSVIGLLFMVARRFGNRHSFALVLGGLVLLAIAFLSVPLGLTGVLPQRWWWNSHLILAIPVAVGLLSVCGWFKGKFSRALVLATLILVLSFFSITAAAANFDNRIYTKNTAARYAFTESELSAMDTLSKISDGKVGVATPAARFYLEFNRNVPVKEIAANLSARDFSNCTGMIVMIRDEVVKNYFDITGGGMKLDYDPREALEEQGFSHVYEGGTVSAFWKQ